MMGFENVSDLIWFVREVFSPAAPLFALVLLGWKVFPEPKIVTQKTEPQQPGRLEGYDVDDDLVPLGPMSGHEKMKAKAGKQSRLRSDLASARPKKQQGRY